MKQYTINVTGVIDPIYIWAYSYKLQEGWYDGRHHHAYLFYGEDGDRVVAVLPTTIVKLINE